MPAKYSHNKLTCFSIFFLLASALHTGCAIERSQTVSRPQHEPILSSPGAVNINIADEDELQNIPGIGPVLAKKIIDHRSRYGPFRRAEDILIVDGISEKRFRESRSFILIE